MDVHVVSYFNFDDKVPTVNCFRHEKDAKAYYNYLTSKGYEHVAIDNCIVFTKIRWENKSK